MEPRSEKGSLTPEPAVLTLKLDCLQIKIKKKKKSQSKSLHICKSGATNLAGKLSGSNANKKTQWVSVFTASINIKKKVAASEGIHFF